MNAFTAALVILGWLPGRFLFELTVPAASPIRKWSTTERLFTELATSWLFVLWVAMTLAELGYLSRGALLGGVGVPTAVLAAVLLSKRRPLFSGPWRPDLVLVAVAALVAFGTYWYAPGFEQIVGARDPITYNLAGVSIARQGSFQIVDEVVTAIPEDEWVELLGPDYRGLGRAHYGPRFQGWYLLDPHSGAVVPQGFPLYPSTIAVGYLAAGIEGALRTTTVTAILAVVGLLFLGRTVAGWPTGATAAALLLVSPAQVWFSRFANAEVIAQLLVIVGLYGFVVFRRHGAALYGILAAVAFGLTWQAHVWTVWLAFALFGVFVFDLVRARVGRLELLAFWGPLAALAAHAAVVYAVFEVAYLRDLLRVLNHSRWALLPVVPGVILVAIGCWLWGRRRAAVQQRPVPEWLRYGLAAGVFGLAVYGYWIRPLVTDAWRAESVERLVLATTSVAFWLATAGVILLILDRRRDEASALFLAIGLGLSLPVLFEPNIRRPLMWSLRRYQTIFPLLFLLTGVALWWIEERHERDAEAGWRGRFGAAVAGGLAVAVVAGLGVEGSRFRGFRQPGRAIEAVEAIAASVEPNAVLVFEARSDLGVLNFAPPLAYWKGFDVVRLHLESAEGGALHDFVRRQARAGRPVYFFTQGFNYYFAEPRMVPHRSWSFDETKMEEIIGRLPDRVIDNRLVFSTYRLEPGGTNGPLEGGLDVGAWDDIYVGEIWPQERAGDLTARWTTARSLFWLPGLDAGATRIVVNAATFVDGAAYPRTLRARLDGVDLGEIELQAAWRDYVFEVPSAWQAVAGAVPRLELETEPLRPDEVSGNGDRRRLGVFVNAILWQ